MNKKERVEAALRGAQVDRVPVSVWGHDYEREWGMQSLAESTAENFNRYDWDYAVICPRNSYLAEGWKAKYSRAADKNKSPICDYTPIRTSNDWKRLRPLEPDYGVLGEHLRVIQLVNHEVGYDAHFAMTLLSPLGVARRLAGNSADPLWLTMKEDRRSLHTALRIINETLIHFAIACLEYGASGIYYSTDDWASPARLTQDQYREYGEQYDMEFFDAIKSRSKFTILHNSGDHIYFDLLSSYQVQAIHWPAHLEGNPSLREGRLRSGKAVMGGINEQLLVKGSSVAQVQDDIAAVLEQTAGEGLLLAPGRPLLPETSSKNLDAVRRALS
jgi:Uroporphyrinogen-III decarboxylase